MLENIVGLAEISGGNLHHYGAAVRDARDLLSRTQSAPSAKPVKP